MYKLKKSYVLRNINIYYYKKAQHGSFLKYEHLIYTENRRRCKPRGLLTERA